MIADLNDASQPSELEISGSRVEHHDNDRIQFGLDVRTPESIGVRCFFQ